MRSSLYLILTGGIIGALIEVAMYPQHIFLKLAFILSLIIYLAIGYFVDNKWKGKL